MNYSDISRPRVVADAKREIHSFVSGLFLAFCILFTQTGLLFPQYGTVSAAPRATTLIAPDDFRYENLASKTPLLLDLAKLGHSLSQPFGIYGGTVRDLFLGRPFSPISDLDLIYDSSAKDFTIFRDELLALSAKHTEKHPNPDFHFDLSDLKSETARQRLYHKEGITATKVGVLIDGTLLDPTGLGVKDLRERVFRYYPPDRSFIELHNIGRFVRDMVRLPGFKRDPATLDLLRRSLHRYADPKTPEGKTIRNVLAASRVETVRLAAIRASAPEPGALYTFADFFNPLRRDGRYQHNDLLKRLTPFFPLDMFMFDLFRTITQADSMDIMREGFRTLEVDEFLRAIGMECEAAVLMDPNLSREDLFKRFAFPGKEPPENSHRLPFFRIWETRLRQHNVRVLFDMLASEFPASAPEHLLLEKKRDSMLATAAWIMLKPDDRYDDTIMGFLDADINIGLLPRERIQKSLDWFRAKYLPLGDVTLSPYQPSLSLVAGSRHENPPRDYQQKHLRSTQSVSGQHLYHDTSQSNSNYVKQNPPHASFSLGFSPEVLAVDPSAPRSFRNLSGYLSYLVGPELIELYRNPHTSLAFVMADEQTTKSLLGKCGYTMIFRVNACGFACRHATLLGFDPNSDRVCISEYGFHTKEQWLNQQMRCMYVLQPMTTSPYDKILTYEAPRSEVDFQRH
ncbi:MAG: hypothetical protein HQM09_04840 [Candidatus Riflebacteria bacterium]|nr:hypothetical protein [Candidatus Riflebacteria bacterium]